MEPGSSIKLDSSTIDDYIFSEYEEGGCLAKMEAAGAGAVV